MLEYILLAVGAVGAVAFAAVNIPQLVKCHRERNTSMISMLTVQLNLVGNVFSLAYVLSTDIINGTWHYPLYLNYSVALAVAILLYRLKKKHG